MTTAEALAVARLRQWAAERCALKGGRVFSYRNAGCPQPTPQTNRFDAALVRILDFDRALASLPADEQTVLVLAYRDKQDQQRIAAALGCSTRKLAYLIPAARQHLANVLDRLDLL